MSCFLEFAGFDAAGRGGWWMDQPVRAAAKAGLGGIPITPRRSIKAPELLNKGTKGCL